MKFGGLQQDRHGHWTPRQPEGPAIVIPSQENHSLQGKNGEINPNESGYESRQIHQVNQHGIIVTQSVIEDEYLDFLQELRGFRPAIFRVPAENKPLSQILLTAKNKFLDFIRSHIDRRGVVFPFEPTDDMQTVADFLRVELFGTPLFANAYGTKAGGKRVAESLGVPTLPWILIDRPPKAQMLQDKFKNTEELIAKYDDSIGGGHLRMNMKPENVAKSMQELTDFMDKRPGTKVLIEPYLPDVISASANIVVKDGFYEVQFVWQQRVVNDMYNGAQPIDPYMQKILLEHIHKLGKYFARSHATGFYCPDFLIHIHNDEIIAELGEINTRMGATMFPALLATELYGYIPDGFVCGHMNIPGVKNFPEILNFLEKNDLLYRRREDGSYRGFIPYNVGLIPYGTCDFMWLGPELTEGQDQFDHLKELFNQR